MRTLAANLRPLRTELVGVAGLVALLVLAAAIVGGRLALLALPAVCLDPTSTDALCAGRGQDALEFQSLTNWISPLAFAAAGLPGIAGVLLGIATVGKELDQQTAVLAWSVSPSRRRWLLARSLPLLALLILLGLGCAQLIVWLASVAYPGQPVPVRFDSIQFVGLAPTALAISSFGITVVIGAMLGRLLPALLAAGALVLATYVLISNGNQRLMANESLLADVSLVGDGFELEPVLRAPDGQIISWGDAYPQWVDPDTGQVRDGVTELVRYVPIEIYPEVAARYVLFHIVVGLAALTLGFAVVERRSP